MDVKSFLEDIKWTDMLIDTKLAQVRDLRQKMEYVSPTFGERVQGSKDPDKFTSGVAKIIELEKVINADIDKLVDDKRVAMEMIESLDTQTEKTILYRHYFDRKTFDEIADEVYYSERWVRKIHSDAIDKLNLKFTSAYFLENH